MYQSKDQRKQEYSKCKRIITNDTKLFNMAGKCENKHRNKADVIRTKTDKVTMKRHPECKKSESNREKTNRDKRDLDKWKLRSKHSRKRSFTIISLADMCTKTILMKACSKPYTEILVNIQIDKTILLKDNYCQDAKTVNVRDSISSIDDYLLNRKTDTNVLCQKTKWTDKSKNSVSDISTPKSLTVDYKGKNLNECEKSTKLDSHSISNDKKSLRDTESFHKKSHKMHNTSGNSNVRSQESKSNCGRTLLKSQESNSNCGRTLLKSQESNSNCGRTLLKSQELNSICGRTLLNSQESNSNCGRTILKSQESISNFGRNLLKSQEVFNESDRNIFAVLGAKALGEADKWAETTKFKTEPVDISYDNSTSLPTCSKSSENKSEKWTEKIKVKTESIDNSYGNLNSFTNPSIDKSNFELRIETTREHCSVGSSSPIRQTAEKNENDVTSDYEGSSTGLPSEDEDIKEEALEPKKCSSLQTDIQPEFDEDLPMLISPQRKKMKLEEKTTCAQRKTSTDSSPKDPKTISNNLKITEKKQPDKTRRSDLKDIIRTKECTSLSKKSVHEKHRSDDFKSIKTLSFESRTNLDTNSEKLTQKANSSEKIKHSEKSNPSKSRHNSTTNDTNNLPSYQKRVDKNPSNKSNVTLNDNVIKEDIKTQNGPFKPDAGVHLEYKHNIKSKEIECKMQAVAVDIFKLANEFQKVKKSYSETTKTEPETIRLDAIVRDECKDKILSKNIVDKAVTIKNKSIISDVQNKMKISTLIDECKRNITTHGNKTNEIARSKSTDKSSTCKNLNKNERKGERKVDDSHRVNNSRDHNRDNRVLNERSRKHDVNYNGRRCDEKYYECRRYDEEKMRRCDGNRRYAKRDFLRADDATKLVGRNGSGAFDKDAIYKPYESGTPIRMSTERDEYKILGNEEKQSCQKQNGRNENSSALIQMNNTEDINQRESDSIIAICQKSTDESKLWKDSENDLPSLEGKSIKTNVSVEENHPSGENVLVLRATSKDTEETKDPITNSASNENFTSMDVTGNESDLVSTYPTEEEDMMLDMSDAHELTSGRSDTNEFFGEHDTRLSTMSDNSSLQQSNMQQLDTHLITYSKITLETDNKSTDIVKQNSVTVSTSVQTHEDALSNQIDHKNVSIPYKDTATTHFSKSTKRSSFDTHNIKESSLENPIKKETLLPTPTNSEQNEQLINLQHNVNKLTTSRPTNASSKWEKITPTLSAKEEIQELSPMEEIQDLSPKEKILVLKSAFISTSVDDAQDICTVISNEVVSNPESSTAPKHLVKFSDINVVNIATSENPTPGLVDTTTPNNNAQKNIDNILIAKANPVAIKIDDNDAKQTDIVVSDKKFQKPVCTTTSNTNVPTKPLDNMTITKDSQKTDYATTTVQNAFEITILDKNNTSTSVCIQKYKKDVITGTRKISATFRDISEKVPVCNKPAVNDALTSDQTSTSHNDVPKLVNTATHDEEVNKNTKLPSLASVDLQTHSSETTNNDVSQTQCSLNYEKFIPESVCVETSSNKPLSTILNENVTGVTLSSISVNDRKNATPTSVESETSTDNMPCSSDIQKQVCITADTLVTSSKTGIVVKQGQSDEEYPANNKKGDNDVVDLLAEHIPKQSPYENKRKIKLLTNTCFLSKKVKIIRSTINRPRIRPKMSPAKRNIVTDASDNISVTIKNEDKEKKDVRQSKTYTEGNNEVKKKDSVVIDLTDEESPKKSNNCKRKIDLEPASESKDNKRGRIEQNKRKIKSKVTIAKQNEIANRIDDTGPKQMRDRKDTDKRRTTESKKNSKYESERNCYKRIDETNRDCNYRTSTNRSNSKEYDRKYESSEYGRNFERKRKYANEHEVPSHLMMNQQPMNDISYVGLKVEPTTAHARCFNEVVGYAYDFMRGYCDYNEISSQYVTPVRRFRTNLMRQLKATFDRYFYGPNNPYDPIYSLTGPQPRFRNEDIMIRTILHTIKKPHIRRGTDCHSCQFDDVIGYEGYKIPCFWVKVEFREGEFLRALPILDRSYAY